MQANTNAVFDQHRFFYLEAESTIWAVDNATIQRSGLEQTLDAWQCRALHEARDTKYLQESRQLFQLFGNFSVNLSRCNDNLIFAEQTV